MLDAAVFSERELLRNRTAHFILRLKKFAEGADCFGIVRVDLGLAGHKYLKLRSRPVFGSARH
jgi:hypothetical protein